MTLELFYQITSVLSLLAYVVSLFLFVYWILRTNKLRPYTLISMETAKAIMLQRFRNFTLLMLLSSLVFFTAYLVKYLMENKVLYSLLEISSLLTFLVATSLLVTSYLQKSK